MSRSTVGERRSRTAWLRRVAATTGVLALVATACVGPTPAPGPGPTNPEPQAGPRAYFIRATQTADFGIDRPEGLAYAADDGALVVAGARGSTTAVAHVTLAGELLTRTAVQGAATLAAVRSAADAPVDTTGLGVPTGAALDASGALLVLDADAQEIDRIEGSGENETVSHISLSALGTTPLRGIAYNDRDGLTYVGSPTEQRLYGVDSSGAVRSTYDVSSVRLPDIQSFAFAPSADPTDPAATQSLYVADSGTTDAGGQLVEMALTAPAALAVTPQQTFLVQTIDTSLWTPAAPDTSGITYQTANDRLMVIDSEVDEVTGAGFAGVNLWQATRTGVVTDTGTTHPAFSAEPTGLSYRESDDTLIVTDDDANTVTFVGAGSDGRHGTADDVRTAMSTLPFSDDVEDVAYDSASGRVYLVDGVAREVFSIDPGTNGTFGDGDDVWSNFDVEQHGVIDPEGIGYDAANDSLLVVDQESHGIYELTTAGALLRIFDLRSAPMLAASDVVVAPNSIRPDRSTFWVVDRGVDNNQDPTENDGRIYELSVDTSGNTAPVVSAVRIDQTAPGTNDVLTATITAHDDDNDPLISRYVWRKNGTQIPGQTGATLDLAVAGNGDKGDVISVRVVAFDGVIESAPRTSGQVTIVDTPPAFDQDLGDRNNIEGDVVSLSAAATDADGDPLTYEATGLPDGLSIDATTGLVSGTVADGASAGSPHAVSISVRQGATADAVDTFAWTVGPRPSNQPPTLTSVTIDQPAPRTNDTLTATVVASDPEGAPLQYSYQWTRNGTDLTGENGPTLSLATDGNGDKGDTIGLRVTVSDGSANTGPVSAAEVTVANSAPVFDVDLADRSSVELNLVLFSAAASDADHDPLRYTASGFPLGVFITPSTGLVFGIVVPGAADRSPYDVSIGVTDGTTASTPDTFTWTVTELNPPPAAPSGLEADVTTRAVHLDWAPNTEGDLAGYNVYRSASASGPFTKVNSSLLTVSHYTDDSAPRGTSFYRVVAVDWWGKRSDPATTSATRSIVFRSAASATARDETRVTVSRPSGVAAGDVLLAAVDVRQAATITAPAGWTAIRTDTNGTTLRQALYYLIATSSEPSSYRWTFSTRQSTAAVIVAYRGAASATTVEDSSGRTNGSSPSIAANGVTTSTPDALLVGVFGGAGNTSVSPPQVMVEAREARQSSGSNTIVLEVADAIVPAAGATGARTASAGASVVSIGQLVAIRPSG